MCQNALAASEPHWPQGLGREREQKGKYMKGEREREKGGIVKFRGNFLYWLKGINAPEQHCRF